MESLRNFIDGFGKVVMSIRNMSPNVAMHHMITTLWTGPLTDNLCMQSAASLDELRWRVAKSMQMEELREFKNQAWTEASGDKGKEEREKWLAVGRGDRRRDNRGHRLIWVDFRIANFIGCSLFMIFYLPIMLRTLRKFLMDTNLTKWLSKCESSLQKGK